MKFKFLDIVNINRGFYSGCDGLVLSYNYISDTYEVKILDKQVWLANGRYEIHSPTVTVEAIDMEIKPA